MIRRFPAAILLLISMTLLALPADARQSEPFASRSSIGIEVGEILRTDERLNRYWKQRPGLSAYWRFPFYVGELGFRASWLPLRADRPDMPDLPDVHNILTTLSWGFPLKFTERVELTPSLLIGNNFMFRPEEGPLEGPESEFAAGLGAHLKYRLTRRLTARAGLQHTRVFTYHRMDFTVGGLALEMDMGMPEWLARFLE